ncbi:MAG: PHB depolymerase family esterase [Alphaproteobacteria bacterium]|nr:PHB depolymerase family esterase [Alphaproteobacteria bacterium]
MPFDWSGKRDTFAALNLVRAGRLADATSLLRRRLGATFGAAAPLEDQPGPAAPYPIRGWRERSATGYRAPRGSAPERPGDTLPPGAEFLVRAYANEAGTRDYRLYVPSGYHGQPVPLIVMLHGCKQSAADFAAGTGMNELAEKQTCLVAYPEQAASANSSQCWNWFSPQHQRRDEGEPSLIAGITGQVAAEFAVDRQRVFVAGLSAGGAEALVMATTYPELYAAVGVHSGLPYGAARNVPGAYAAMRQGWSSSHSPGEGVTGKPSRMVPTILFHGDQDKTVNPRNSDQILRQAGRERLREQAVEEGRAPVAGGHAYTRCTFLDTDGRVVLEAWVVHGAGHAWSGGSPNGSYTDPLGPDAAKEMLRFFLDHPLASG